MVVWFLTGLGHVCAPRFLQHNFDVIGGIVQMVVAVALFSLMTRTARRRKAASSLT